MTHRNLEQTISESTSRSNFIPFLDTSETQRIGHLLYLYNCKPVDYSLPLVQ